MLLDEDIQIKQDNARRLMIEDITNAVINNSGSIELPRVEYIKYGVEVTGVDEVVCNECGVHLVTEQGNISITQMYYDELKQLYQALKSEGYFRQD